MTANTTNQPAKAPAPREGDTRVVTLNGSRITMKFIGGQWINVKVE